MRCSFAMNFHLNQKFIPIVQFKFLHHVELLVFLNLLLASVPHGEASYEMQGPNFLTEPASRVEFTNVSGGRVDCIVRGNPEPTVDWLAADGGSVVTIPGIRHVLGNGTVHFPAFEAEAFRQDVHWAIYKCSAINSVGAVVSRDVTVRAVVHQRYGPEVQSPGGFLGNNVLMRCNVPSFVRDHVSVTSWLQEPSFNIYPSTISDGKYHMLPSGELLIINISRSDVQMTYRCRTHNRLTQETVVSNNFGRVQLTEARGAMPPMLSDKLVYISARVEETIVIPCVAYANPRPTNRWYYNRNQRDEPIDESSGHFLVRDGSLIIQNVQELDAGSYMCTASNSEGSGSMEVKLTVSAPLSVHVQPAIQTVDLGKPAFLTCSASGFPQAAFYWLKDGQPLRTGARIRIVSRERISVTSVAREDRGMYQCFVRNEHEMAQGIAELRLGEIAPQLVYRFIEQTMQPGPSVSLKCSAAGNPTPQISWLVDGFPLPQNDRLLIGQYVTVYGDVISHVNISSVKPEDGGEYECTASSKAGEAKHSARLNIYGLLYVREMPTISAVAGKQLYIKCPVAGYPIEAIIWEKDGSRLPTNMRQRVLNGTLTIETVQQNADLGTYTCTARNKHNFTAYRSVEVRVLVPPKITPFNFARDLNVGDRTSIQCVVVTGDLPLTFTWLKDNVPIDEVSDTSLTGLESSIVIGSKKSGHADQPRPRDQGQQLKAINIRQYDAFNSALSISTIAPAHNGTYTCRVANGADTVAHSALLHVNVPPRIAPFYFETGVTQGMRTQLMCTTSQGDQPFNITWLMDKKPIELKENGDVSSNQLSTSEENNNIQISAYPPFSSILTISNVTAKHSGNYTCSISNIAGVTEHSARLSVTVPPQWKIEPINQDAIVGHSVSIACQAEGFPIPSVTWKQSNSENPGDYRELGYGGTEGAGVAANGSLVIPRVSREHSGSYLCKATNGIGPGLSKLIQLTVHAGPSVTVRSREESVRRGEKVTLRCEAEGDAPLDLSWRTRGSTVGTTYDDRYTVKNSPTTLGLVSELRIIQAGHADRGEYVCVARNAYGHDKVTVHLLVQEPPNFPRNLHVAELGSRAITLEWSTPSSVADSLHPDSPISKYVVQYKEAQDVWHEHNTQKMIEGDKTVALVSPLKPATTYHFRVFAENHLGTSAPSDILHVQTQGEVPGGPPRQVSIKPISPQQMKITWQPPDRSLWNGELQGYAITFTNLGSDEQLANETRIRITSNGDGSYDYRLTGLRKYTQYSIVVKAFNSKGDGPGSDPMIAQTLEDVPSSPPQNVACTALNGQNIQVTWKPPPSDKVHGMVVGYKVVYEATNGVMEIDMQGSPETRITQALSAVLHGLNPYTNYTVQVLASTRAGDGVSSIPVSCTTEEDVPGAPERVKAVASAEDSMVISWLPPRRPNGVLTKYTVFIRVLDQGQEVKIIKDSLPAHNLHYDATGLKLRESYEAWVTASTKVGQGPTTPVVKFNPSATISAAIISFGVPVIVPWRVDVNLACHSVGNPKPIVEWRMGDLKLQKQQQRLDVGSDNTLLLQNVQRTQEGNYSCHARNSLGSDEIVYSLHVQVPPTPPTLLATATTNDAVQLQWKQGDNGGSSIKGFLLAYRKEFAEWEEVMLDRRASTHLLEGLQCGTKYQFTLAAFNRIGSGGASEIENARTKGTKPLPPSKQHFVKANLTSVILELASWQDGGCPLLYFVVEYRRYPGEWLLVSNNVPPQTRFPIVSLESGTSYELRITAYNNAGSTHAEYLFTTLTSTGNTRMQEGPPIDAGDTPLYLDAQVLAPSVISLFAVILAVAGVCFCLRTHPVRSGSTNDPNAQNQAALENKHNMEQREQYYATVRKPGQQSPCREVSALERIPEYSEDIYPYATFHLPEQENLSANPMRQAYFYERSETMLQGAQCDVDQYTKVRGRSRRKSKSFKSESEEYDTLGSDSDTEVGTSSRTESSNHLEDSGPASIMARSPGPNSGQRGREQRLALVPRPVHHNVLYHTHESSTSTEPSPISERKTLPRLEKQRYRGGPLDVSMDANRPIIKLTESGIRSYSTNASPSHLNNHTRMSTYDRPKDSSERKSVESLCHLDDGGNRNYQKNSRYRHREKGGEWGNELSTLELKPPTGFTDAHETSEAECDIDMKLRLHRKRGTGQNCQLSKSPQDFTITV
ncbi:cell adhesion molecule Dscam2-like isoform X4 [Leptopilina boulardi]|uniref:cell adhesion molecule Dscam2-like isoform X4 n=1 Tax=Leptopilina boulardi TaxID=63433 RepID=UPI0021F63C47|nr:cell adhesion molecule Dscam2-like isoform X4 [Leptopilina boulardi]